MVTTVSFVCPPESFLLQTPNVTDSRAQPDSSPDSDTESDSSGLMYPPSPKEEDAPSVFVQHHTVPTPTQVFKTSKMSLSPPFSTTTTPITTTVSMVSNACSSSASLPSMQTFHREPRRFILSPDMSFHPEFDEHSNGSVVLLVQKVLFRVSRIHLSSVSKWFKQCFVDALGNSTRAVQYATWNGCPVININMTYAEDFGVLLSISKTPPYVFACVHSNVCDN